MPTYAVPPSIAEVARLMAEHPMGDAVVDRVDGRRIRVAGHRLTDFASCTYLGFDLDPEIIAGVPEYLARWGTHPSWARGIASPALYQRIEAEVGELLGAEDVLAFPTLTHTHFGVLPALAGRGRSWSTCAHRTIHEAAALARGRGPRSGGSATTTSSTPSGCSAAPPGRRGSSASTASTR
jgi:8-amino-7-oxononanoate synthase